MYLEGSPTYEWHVKNFGHPSKVGFKDVVPTFKAVVAPSDGEYLLSKQGESRFLGP
jgi:alpha-L-fucosidase